MGSETKKQRSTSNRIERGFRRDVRRDLWKFSREKYVLWDLGTPYVWRKLLDGKMGWYSDPSVLAAIREKRDRTPTATWTIAFGGEVYNIQTVTG